MVYELLQHAPITEQEFSIYGLCGFNAGVGTIYLQNSLLHHLVATRGVLVIYQVKIVASFTIEW